MAEADEPDNTDSETVRYFTEASLRVNAVYEREMQRWRDGARLDEPTVMEIFDLTRRERAEELQLREKQVRQAEAAAQQRAAELLLREKQAEEAVPEAAPGPKPDGRQMVRAKRAIEKCFPDGTDGIPAPAIRRAIGEHLADENKRLGLPTPSETVIKKALGRRK